MIQRCYNSNLEKYEEYGAKGIRVCKDWRQSFLLFYKWSMINSYDDTKMIDRKNGTKGYFPENCRWVSVKISNNNLKSNVRIKAFGETKTIGEWASDKRCVASYRLLQQRMKSGNWTAKEAITTPATR